MTTTKPSPWVPETNPLRLAVLSKLLEELNEAGSAAARCIAQGINEVEPVTGKPNKAWLEEELADVLATFEHAAFHLDLDTAAITARKEAKAVYLGEWYDMFVTSAPVASTLQGRLATVQEINQITAAVGRPYARD